MELDYYKSISTTRVNSNESESRIVVNESILKAAADLPRGHRSGCTCGLIAGNVRQLEKVSRELLAELACRAPLLPREYQVVASVYQGPGW